MNINFLIASAHMITLPPIKLFILFFVYMMNVAH